MNAQAPISDAALSGEEKIIVLAPHPDDETLGCGGLLTRAFAGAGAHVICLTDGSASHPGSTLWPPRRLAEERRRELIAALRILGGSAADLTWLGLPDSLLHEEDLSSIVAALQRVVHDQAARHIFVPAQEDKHCDHKTTARIATALRRDNPDLQFYSYPVWSRWDDPDFDQRAAAHGAMRLETSHAESRKRAAIAAHRSQLGQLVTDDPQGFVLPTEFIEKFASESEIFWRMP